METTWPRSSSPCSGVLKFRLASNASANVASAVSLDWVMGLLDTFREVDPGPRDRLGSVSYSKVSGPSSADHYVAKACFIPAENRADEAAKKVSATLAPRKSRTYIGGPCRAGCSMADVNGAGRRNKSRWDLWRGGANASLQLLTRRSRCDGQRTSERSIRMPSGGCQRIENGPARPEIAGLFVLIRSPA